MNHEKMPRGLPIDCLISSAAIALITLAGCGTGHDPAIVEVVLDNGCVSRVVPSGGRSCGGAGPVMAGDTCVHRGDEVTWSTPGTNGFCIVFAGGSSPMTTDCPVTKANCPSTKTDPSVTCKVASNASRRNYRYDIQPKECNREFDPRIIVR